MMHRTRSALGIVIYFGDGLPGFVCRSRSQQEGVATRSKSKNAMFEHCEELEKIDGIGCSNCFRSASIHSISWSSLISVSRHQ